MVVGDPVGLYVGLLDGGVGDSDGSNVIGGFVILPPSSDGIVVGLDVVGLNVVGTLLVGLLVVGLSVVGLLVIGLSVGEPVVGTIGVGLEVVGSIVIGIGVGSILGSFDGDLLG